MKKILILILPILSVALFSCNKTETINCCGIGSAPYIQAVKNGSDWKAVSVTQKMASDSIAITGLSQSERLVMHIKFTGKGTYALAGDQAKYLTMAGSDVLTSQYNSDDAGVNTVEVTSYDAVKGLIGGTFSVALKKTMAKDESSPENIKFLKGGFSASIK